MDALLKDFKYQITQTPNFIKLPVNYLPLDEENIEIFNSIYNWLRANVEKRITRTRSGGISVAGTNARGNQWDFFYRKNHCVALTFKYYSKWYRIQIGGRKKESDKELDKEISGRYSWSIFKRICLKHGIDIENYKITSEEGKEYKLKIPSPIIRLGREEYEGKTFKNVHHIDRNSSYAFGIIEKAPELRIPIEEIYLKRKENPEYKQVLAHLHGVMQSYVLNYQYAHLSLAANVSNVQWLTRMAKKVRAAGGQILLYNTDGFWYSGEIYHDEDEGSLIGQWKTDHKNCTFRMKSCGSYEFIEDGIYHPVYRGTSSYEKVKARKDWKWGDIFKGVIKYWKFDEDLGIVRDLETEKWLN